MTISLCGNICYEKLSCDKTTNNYNCKAVSLPRITSDGKKI